jgi:hypothetical protein
MLIMALKYMLPVGSRIRCLYDKANDYAKHPHDIEYHGWLTRGIVDIRSILGYGGRISLIADTHLILLPGFETERAHGIIDSLQPDRLTIGHINPEESIRPEFAPVLENFTEQLTNYNPDWKIEHFQFSARDPIQTSYNLLARVNDSENTIVACLNTKLAMMGVIIAALANRNIQLVYSQPAKYNIKCLSAPSDEAIAFDVL